MSLLSAYGMHLRTVRASSNRIGSPFRTFAACAIMLLAACGGGGDPVITVTSVSVSPLVVSVAIGASTQLTATVLDQNNATVSSPVTWQSANTSIATVNGTGLVTAVAPGTVAITATSQSKNSTALVTVTPPPVATITLTPATPSVVEADTVRVTAVLKGADGATLTGRTVTWSASPVTTATVSNAGLVTGVQPGTATITATSEGKSASVSVTVRIDPCRLSLSTAIVSGVVANGTLANTDCDLGDGTFLDVYVATVASRTTMETVMRSSAFDAYIFIFTLVGQSLVDYGEDNNSGGGTDARLEGAIDAGTHFILANSNVPGFGAYTLRFTAPFSSLTAQSHFSPPPAMTLRKLNAREATVVRSMIRKSALRR